MLHLILLSLATYHIYDRSWYDCCHYYICLVSFSDLKILKSLLSTRYLGGRDLSELVDLSGFTEYPAERFKPRDTSVMEYIWGPPPEDENVENV